METKILEIRDRATCIPIMAARPSVAVCRTAREFAIVSRAGFKHAGPVIVCKLSSGDCQLAPEAWGDRTMSTAHLFIRNHWEEIESGETVDVPLILGESDKPMGSDIR